jgi:hypothetical protein
MKYVIERAATDGRLEFYAGFVEGRASWSGTRNRAAQFASEESERILQQLRGLGFVVERRALEKKR